MEKEKNTAVLLAGPAAGLKSEDHGLIAVNEYLVRDNPA